MAANRLCYDKPGQVIIQTSGHRHGPVTLDPWLSYDVQKPLHNPSNDPTMRYRTGLDSDVRRHVMATPGAEKIIAGIVDDILECVAVANPRRDRVDVAIVCAGGRHRSVVVAEAVADRLEVSGIGVEVEHRDVDKPVLPPVPA